MSSRKLLAAAGLASTTLIAGMSMGQSSLNAENIDAVVLQGIAEKHYPGATLVIGRKNEILYQNSYGHYTYDPDAKPVSLDTLYDLASLTKVVATATTAMALIEEGKISLDAPVSNYVDGFGVEGKQDVTVRDLLTHVSGLKAYDSPDNARKLERAGVTTADALLMRIASLPVSNEPRTTTTYSCLNMLTQARVNENVLGGRQDDFLTTRVYGRLGMDNTAYRLTPEQLERTAPTIRRADGSGLIGKVHDPLASYHSIEDHCSGNAGLFSTAPDLSRFCEMIAGLGNFRGQQVFKPETIVEMTSIQTPPHLTNVRGLGWDVYQRPPYATPANAVDGKRAVAHTGYTGTMIWIDMNTGAYMVLLTNRSYPDDSNESKRGLSAVRAQIAELILKSQPEYAEYFNESDRLQ